MADFRPHQGMAITVGATPFDFMPHPLFPGDIDEVYVIEGGEALVYQLRNLATGELCALKVNKQSFRGEHIDRSVAALAPYAHLNGLFLGNRICLTAAEFPALIDAFPDLEYAVLMPWIQGRSWAGLVGDRLASEHYTPGSALRLALVTAQVLWDLEAHHLAHTDVSGGNIALAPDLSRVELLDIDNLYMPNVPPPKRQSFGTPGYQHRNLDGRGQYCAEGDRFAGAMLLAEMLTWWDPPVRARTPEGAESLFQPRELQEVGAPRWEAVRDALWAICPPALALFDQAWASSTLAECPELGTWAMCLIQAYGNGSLAALGL